MHLASGLDKWILLVAADWLATADLRRVDRGKSIGVRRAERVVSAAAAAVQTIALVMLVIYLMFALVGLLLVADWPAAAATS